MRGFKVTQVLALGLASATAVAAADDPSYDPSLNFRPDNVTMNGLYHWVGSYYNGSTTIKIEPFAGVAAKEEGGDDGTWCPNLKDKTYNVKFDTILALTERSKYNAGNNPLNVFMTFWDVGYDFGLLKESTQMGNMTWEWGLFSSVPVYSYNRSETELDGFNFTLAKTDKAPYNVSSILSQYGSEAHAETASLMPFNMTSCNGTKDTNWAAAMISNYWWTYAGYNVSYPDPTFDVVFDNETANITLNAYIMAVQDCQEDPLNQNFCDADTLIEAKMTITFEGAIDSYHSDELETNSSKPTWLRTVGFKNSTQTSGNSTSDKKNDSNGRQYPGAMSLVSSAIALSIFSLYI